MALLSGRVPDLLRRSPLEGETRSSVLEKAAGR